MKGNLEDLIHLKLHEYWNLYVITYMVQISRCILLAFLESIVLSRIMFCLSLPVPASCSNWNHLTFITFRIVLLNTLWPSFLIRMSAMKRLKCRKCQL